MRAVRLSHMILSGRQQDSVAYAGWCIHRKEVLLSRTQAGIVICLLLVGIVLLGYCFFEPTPEPEAPTRWEYTLESPSDYSFTGDMNRLGAEQWELVFARRALDSTTDSYNYEVILKRPVTD